MLYAVNLLQWCISIVSQTNWKKAYYRKYSSKLHYKSQPQSNLWPSRVKEGKFEKTSGHLVKCGSTASSSTLLVKSFMGRAGTGRKLLRHKPCADWNTSSLQPNTSYKLSAVLLKRKAVIVLSFGLWFLWKCRATGRLIALLWVIQGANDFLLFWKWALMRTLSEVGSELLGAKMRLKRETGAGGGAQVRKAECSEIKVCTWPKASPNQWLSVIFYRCGKQRRNQERLRILCKIMLIFLILSVILNWLIKFSVSDNYFYRSRSVERKEH